MGSGHGTVDKAIREMDGVGDAEAAAVFGVVVGGDVGVCAIRIGGGEGAGGEDSHTASGDGHAFFNVRVSLSSE